MPITSIAPLNDVGAGGVHAEKQLRQEAPEEEVERDAERREEGEEDQPRRPLQSLSASDESDAGGRKESNSISKAVMRKI